MSYLTDEDLKLLVAWARDPDKTSPKFILNKKQWHNSVIFGADTPQRRYLQFIELANKLETEYDDKLPNQAVVKNADKLREYFKKSGLFKMTKEDFNRVSNFWLKPIQSVALYATKQALANSPPAKANQYIAESNPGSGEVRKFWQRFGESPQGLQHKVIPAAGQADFASSKAAQVTKTGREKDTEHHVYDFAVRRACKFLMYDAKAMKRPVFYALDGLDLSMVVDLVTDTGALRDTVKVGKTAEEKKVPVCTSELRELFRYWDELRNHVFFFENFVEVKPPWEQSNVDKWGTYAVLRPRRPVR
jgi:hypothetical protein